MGSAHPRLTFLLTDIEGSTALWEHDAEAAAHALAQHDEILSTVIAKHGGTVVKSRGEGDAAFCVFEATPDAVKAAVRLQEELSAAKWTTASPIRVRVALHSGEAQARDGDYFGPTVNRCARLRAIAHGGQIVVSEAVQRATDGQFRYRDHGQHRLKDLLQPERVYEAKWSDAEFPPLRSLNAFDHNLPIQLTSFLGREQDLTNVAHALDKARMVTLTGIGGCGKTRLALQAGAQVAGLTKNVVRFVSLAELPPGSSVDHEIARTVGADQQGTGDALGSVIEALKDSEALLILDNCEHVIESASRAAKRIVTVCPRVQVLTTSREGLGLTGEVVYVVESMTLPIEPEDHPLRAMNSESVALFVDRVRMRDSRFALDAASVAGVVRLVRALDGIPLAIEQAAARAAVLGLDGVVERLGNKLELLQSAVRDSEPRQRTVRATLEWSHELLSPGEREVFARLSAFQGVFSVTDACTVCGREVVGEIESLVQKSVVNAVHVSSHETGYRLLETVKEFGQERIGTDAPDAYKRHLEWAMETAKWIDETIEGPSSAEAFQKLDAVYSDLETALRRMLDAGDARSLRMAFLLRRPWLFRGPTAQGVELMMSALVAPIEVDAELRAESHNALGAMAMFVGKGELALKNLIEAARRFDALGKPTKSAAARANLGILYALAGQFSDALPCFESSLSAYSSAGDTDGAAKVALNLGRMLIDADRPQDAIPHLELALETFRARDPIREAQALTNLAWTVPLCDTAQVTDYLERAFEILGVSPDQSGMSVALVRLAQVAMRLGRPAEATILIEASNDYRRTIRDDPFRFILAAIQVLEDEVRAQLEPGHAERARLQAKEMDNGARMAYAVALARELSTLEG